LQAVVKGPGCGEVAVRWFAGHTCERLLGDVLWYSYLLLVIMWVLLGSLPGTGSTMPSASKAAGSHAVLTPSLSTGRDHLLVYAFSYTDSEFLHNLQYFIREAVEGDTLADYIIIVQEGPTLKVI